MKQPSHAEEKMKTAMNLARCVAILLVLLSCFAQTSKTHGNVDALSSKLERMPQSLEIRFALSALPPYLRGGASTYVLDPAAGYVLAEKGTNGFTCIVMRTEWAWPQLPFRDDIYVPICYDAEGSQKMLPVWMDAARVRATGLTPKQVYEGIMNKFSDGTYQKPARTGISYMTAPLMRSYPAPDATEVMTMSAPHYMFYAPNVKDADIGESPLVSIPSCCRRVRVPTT